ncbi:MAG: KEOPS complex subunit Cgi121 [Methanosarcinaceae archaeon]|nr:KEOPS complex subunit Cgi121 [Methanosarcinaceae archaeon]MDD4332352.1 KEOPS complex subunit Cgi121 [Methanosarcinaceae archaeon]MDD4749243.1 KEOPS complex subunit Cgi121 [Methanosarcinaceae archaeon]
MKGHIEYRILCGTLNIPDLHEFLNKTKALATACGVVIQGLNSDLLAGKRHLDFAIEKALRAFAEGKNVAKDPGIEIMRYAAGERQIERSFLLGLSEGENRGAFVVLGGDIEKVEQALLGLKEFFIETSCSAQLAYTPEKRKGILEKFGIEEPELEAAGDAQIPELVLERVALADFSK